MNGLMKEINYYNKLEYNLMNIFKNININTNYIL